METASEPRHRRRITCGLTIGSVRRPAMVLNLSRSGVFVQTTQKPRRGERVTVDLSLPGASRSIELSGDVVWRRDVASRFSSFGAGGVGIRLLGPADDYLRFVGGLAADAGEAADPPAAADPVASEPLPPPAAPRFRVRLKRTGTTRSRWVAVSGASLDEARGQALSSAGEGWEVLELQRAREAE